MTSFVNIYHFKFVHAWYLLYRRQPKLNLRFALALTSVRNEPFSLFHFNVLLCLPLEESVIYCFSPCVCLPVCPSQHPVRSNLITVRYISTKLRTFVKHIQTTCHAQEPQLWHVYLPNCSHCNINKGILSTL